MREQVMHRGRDQHVLRSVAMEAMAAMEGLAVAVVRQLDVVVKSEAAASSVAQTMPVDLCVVAVSARNATPVQCLSTVLIAVWAGCPNVLVHDWRNP